MNCGHVQNGGFRLRSMYQMDWSSALDIA